MHGDKMFGEEETIKLKVYKIPYKDRESLIFIPYLGKVYKVQNDNLSLIPEEIVYKKKILRSNNHKDILNLVLFLTNACNLQCVYCYGNYGAVSSSRSLSFDIVKTVLEYVFFNSDKNEIRISYFGGEPTLRWNLVVAITYLSRSLAVKSGKKVTFGITTNGCFPEERVRWLVNNMDAIVISIDGFKSIHDNQRSNSFDRVYKIAKLMYSFKECANKIRIRITVSNQSVQYIPQIVEFFGKEFPESKQLYEPLSSLGRGENNNIYTPPSPSMFFEKLLEALPVAERLGCSIRTSIMRWRPYAEAYCGIVGANLMITPEGKIIVCNRKANDNEESPFVIGRVNGKEKKLIFQEEKIKGLQRFLTRNIPECQNCFAEFACKGDCPANKSAVNSENFWQKPSYRCQEIREFIKKLLIFTIEHKRAILY